MHGGRARLRRAVWAVCFAIPVALIAIAGVSAWMSLPGGSTAAAAAAPTTAAPSAPSATTPAAVTAAIPDDALPANDPPPAASPPPDPEPEPPAPFDPIRPGCAGPTVMTVWAHYDDDLLFLGNPITDALAGGQCVRTVFLTGGDAGKGRDYSSSRERGILRAYDVMRGAQGPWSATAATLGSGAQVTVWSPTDEPRLSLVFFRLPDGNLDGAGYPTTGEVSLAKVAGDKIADIPDLDGRYRLNWSGLVSSVQELITGFAPTTFYTHVPGSAHRFAKGDHADHAITGVIARTAWLGAALPGATASYSVGYQSAGYPVNVSGDALSRKIAAFRAYASDDSVTAGCHDDASCLAMPRFGDWLQRQYTKSEAEVAAG